MYFGTPQQIFSDITKFHKNQSGYPLFMLPIETFTPIISKWAHICSILVNDKMISNSFQAPENPYLVITVLIIWCMSNFPPNNFSNWLSSLFVFTGNSPQK